MNFISPVHFLYERKRTMVDYDRVQDFLEAHDMDPERVDPKREAALMLEDMRRGLAGEKSDMPMIPTYLSNDAQLPLGRSVAVIDAGGTNFRSALVRFEEDGCHVSELSKCRMPGVGEPCTWEEFISFVADRIEPLMGRAESIGFCFSYSADITPDMDGRVIRIDKEVVVTGSEGKLIGASLRAELERRGITGKRVVILNDTVAVLLGGAAGLDKRAYSGFIGQVSGTGTNTCVSLPERLIGKLGSSEERGMIINMEAGLYTGIPRGSFDLMLDSASNNPGLKAFEKLTAGVYLGQLCRLMLIAAADEGLISRAAGDGARQLEDIDSSVIDAWACMERGELLGGAETDLAFASRLSRALTLQVKGQSYMMALKAGGLSDIKIIFRHVLKNISPSIISLATMEIGSIILHIASFSFLGLGVQAPTPEWGIMLADSKSYIQTYPRLMIFPGVLIMIVVLTFNFLGEGIQDGIGGN